MIDIVKIKTEVQKGHIKFIVIAGIIFCEDPKNGERVAVGAFDNK